MRKFHELFAGRDDVYGTYALSKAQKSTPKGDKRLGRAKTVSAEVTPELYDLHLSGEQSIGIVPIRLDGTVSWFAIDVDDYNTSDLHHDIAKKIAKLNLPLIIFETKSGGAHLYCFLTEPVEAVAAREYAEKFVRALGLSKKTEIFPKQDAIRKSDKGSWINLPYFGDSRVCLGEDGMGHLSLDEFLLFVSEREIHPSDLNFRQNEIKDRVDPEEKDIPPCISTLLRDGIEEGGRDNALTHIAVYLKRAFPDEWQEKLTDINDTLVTPPLGFREVMRIIKSSERKDYQYLCKQTPMVSFCDKARCVKSKYGVGDGEPVTSNFSIDSIRKIGEDDPYYVITVDGLPIRLTSAQLMDFKTFKRYVFEKHNKIIGTLKPNDWEALLIDAMEDLEIEEAPEEFGTVGMIRRAFFDWTSQRLTGFKRRIHVIDGQPYYDDENRAIFFRGVDFIAYCRRNLSYNIDSRVIWLVLEEDGAEEQRINVRGHRMRLWRYPVVEPWFEIQAAGESF